MIALTTNKGPLDILCLGAHPDDIEIGCGGTLLELAQRPETTVSGVVLTGQANRRQEAEAALPRFYPGSAVQVLGLRDGRLPAHWGEVKDALEQLATQHRPGLIFAPRVDDAHQDHRLIGRLASTTWRDTLILHYEIPKWDGDLVTPTHYVPVGADNASRKVELLNKSYPSQVGRDWWDDELYLGLMRVRGTECRSKYAEGFVATKVVMDVTGGGADGSSI
ncbi:MAG: PIG-L family deacetylase [Actinomycetia bacterium]|nr:PIG-L family deacetylase [Actinomycetes bacterium]